jgi:ANTAR domain
MTLDGSDEPAEAALAEAENDVAARLQTRAQETIELAQELQEIVNRPRDSGSVDQRSTGDGVQAQAEPTRESGPRRPVLDELRAEVDGLRRAMETRATIEQAKGILMGAEHCTPDEAFRMLVRASQRENRKLALIAAEIVERAVGAGRDDARGPRRPTPREPAPERPASR